MRKSVIETTLILTASIGAWFFTGYAYLFFVTLGLCLLFAAGMAIYLLARWRQLSGADRQQGLFALIGWLAMAYLVVHINGLSLGTML